MKSKLLVLTASVLLISSCSILSPIDKGTENAYVINTVPTNVPKRPTHAMTLLVSQPESKSIYDTTQMAYTTKPYQISYYALNKWAEKPSEMLLPLMVQTIQNTHLFHAVVAPPYVGHNDYLLSSQILKLQQDYTVTPAALQIIMRVQIIRMSTSSTIAIRDFAVSVPITQRTPYGGVIAANKATNILLRQIAQFCIRNI